MATAKRILAVEDDIFILDLISHILESAGHKTARASTAAEATALFGTASYDLVILDLTLPDEDGLTVARQIRARSDVPIIVLSGRSERSSLIAALEIGVDDYVVKPADPQELLLRVKNQLERRGGGGGEQYRIHGLFKFGNWELNAEARTLTNASGEDVRLTKAEFDLLQALVSSPNRVLERNFLLDAIGRADQPETNRTIDVLIGRLRAKIEADVKAPEHIQTVFGVGYRFATRVERT